MLRLKEEFQKIIIKQCLEEFPNEACGILAGKDGRVEKVYLMTNIDKSPQSYIMDPKEQLKVQKEMRTLGLEMVGIYHSHTASEARPSARDIDEVFYPDAFYVIVSLKDKFNPQIHAFKINEGDVEEKEVCIE
ncbi:MAG: M67 family metallopeptidase [Candidatus Omnitrophota bacterium]